VFRFGINVRGPTQREFFCRRGSLENEGRQQEEGNPENRNELEDNVNTSFSRRSPAGLYPGLLGIREKEEQ
jgi:hypothetical protein